MCHSRTAICLRAVLALVLIGVSSSLCALANRVFVSARSGNDANSCDNINTPCQTLAGAVVQLNLGGEAIVLDSGGYGKVTITQSLTIEAPPGVVAFIHPSSGDAITITAGPTDNVVLRGLVLNGGPGYGILANSVGTLHIENCVISGFTSRGIAIQAAGSKTFVKDTISRQNGSDGIGFSNSGRASVDHCRFDGNGARGCIVVNTDVTISNSTAAGNVEAGFQALGLGSNTVLNVYECVSTNNGGNGLFADNPLTTVRVANSSISENLGIGLVNVVASGAVFESLGNNFVRGNAGGDTSGTITLVAPK